MSAHATVWAWNQKAGKAKAVLIALANFADSEGVCRVPQTVLAAMTEDSVKTVQRHVRYLECLNLITREKSWDDDGRQELDKIQLCGLGENRKTRAEKHCVSGGDKMSPYRESGGDKMSPIDKDIYSLLEVKSSTNNSACEFGDLPEQPEFSPGEDVGFDLPELETEVPCCEQRAPDGVASDEAKPELSSLTELKNTYYDGESVNAQGFENVPPPASRYRAAMDAISGAGLLPVWRDWVRLNQLKQVTQESQAPVWAEWIATGRAEKLRQDALDIIQSGSFSHPWGALRKRMQVQDFDPHGGQVQKPAPSGPFFSVGERVRYPDGSEATIIAILSRGITTDHPDYPDVPLAHVRTLTVIP